MKPPVMEIKAENLGKKFNHQWIFRNLNDTFKSGNAYAITGRNGSGKSTLLQVISGFLTPSEGAIRYSLDNKVIDPESIYAYLALATPYLELMEEFTLTEQIRFHSRFKSPYPGLTEENILELSLLSPHKNKEIKYFSSGMCQRLCLSLALLYDNPLILLDEPSSHLDAKGFEWFTGLLEKFSKDRLVFISSNQPREYEHCNKVINIEEY